MKHTTVENQETTPLSKQHRSVAALCIGAMAVSLMFVSCGVEQQELTEGERTDVAGAVDELATGPQVATFLLNNGAAYVYSNQPATATVTMTAACPTGGCTVPLYTTNSTLFPLPSSFTVPAGATTANFVVNVGTTTYPYPLSASAGGRYAYFDVFAALGAPNADGSFNMIAFGSSYRTGTGGVTKSLNKQMAISNMESNLLYKVPKQCAAAIPNGVVTRVGSPVIKGEYRNSRGLLQYDVTQNVKCSR